MPIYQAYTITGVVLFLIDLKGTIETIKYILFTWDKVFKLKIKCVQQREYIFHTIFRIKQDEGCSINHISPFMSVRNKVFLRILINRKMNKINKNWSNISVN